MNTIFPYQINNNFVFPQNNIIINNTPSGIIPILPNTKKSTPKNLQITKKETKQWICKICDRSFLHESNLIIHSVIHTDKALYCRFCNKAFARASNLEQHLRIHTDYRPYNCPNCDKSFRQKHRFLILFAFN